MLQILEGIYYDGQSSKPHPVQVELSASTISILGKEDAFPRIHSIWQIDQLEDIDFTSSDTVHLKYGEFPDQSLLIEEPNDAKIFREYYPQFSEVNIYRKVLSGNVAQVVGTAA